MFFKPNKKLGKGGVKIWEKKGQKATPAQREKTLEKGKGFNTQGFGAQKKTEKH